MDVGTNNANNNNNGVVWEGQLPSAEELADQLHPGDYPPMEDHDVVDDDAYLFHEFDNDDHDAHDANRLSSAGANQSGGSQDDDDEFPQHERLPPYNSSEIYSQQYEITRPRTTSEGGIEGVDYYQQHHVHRSNSFGKFSALTAAAVAAKPPTPPSPVDSAVGGGDGNIGVYQRQRQSSISSTTSTIAPLPPPPTLPGGIGLGAAVAGSSSGGLPIMMKTSNSNKISDNNTIEKTGRWTKEEHEAFLVGLELYGKEWKKVAGKVKTRTVVQTRTHAQKYFQKVAKGGEVSCLC